mmetsp:Transcript_20013/g.29973  ORF Transcript_20013/g.29973 Transcript_20013/m.29973 type:complete len:909 (+) Transcript_20013:53-2779(+)
MHRVMRSRMGAKGMRRVGNGKGRALRRWFTQGKKVDEPEVPSEADVVIVGGGSLGASIAYHLAERKVKVVLLEKSKLTSGTTWHSAGMLWRLRPSDTDVELQAYTRDMCKKLEKETEIESWTENGGLFIANNKNRMDEYKRLGELGKFYGVESHLLDPSQTKELYPLLNTEGIYGALYSPGDGTIDPTNIVMAYTKAARSRGAVILEDVAVKAVHTENSGGDRPSVNEIVTQQGQRIKTKLVVNAGGVWSNSLDIVGAPGTKLPICAMKHAFVTTESIPGVNPSLPNVRDHDKSVYLKTQGDALAIGGYEPNPEFWPNVDPDFSFGLFELDWDTFGHNLEGHLTLCPAIEEAGISSTVCGPEGFTPDHKPLVGPHPNLQGYFVACGMNSMGMMLGGGLGREISTWIIEGSPNLDLFSFDIARFHPTLTEDQIWNENRSHESYAKTYAIVFPHDEPLAGRNHRRSALHDVLLEKGCVFQERHGFERPGWFSDEKSEVHKYDFYGAYPDLTVSGLERETGDPIEQYLYKDKIEGDCTFGWPASHETVKKEVKAAREGAALFDQSYFGKYLIRGKDSRKFMDYVSSARLDEEAAPPGRVVYTAWCNQRGGVEADLTVTCLPDGGMDAEFYIAAGGATATHNLRWLQKIQRDENFDCEIVDISDKYSMLSLQGPESRKILEKALDTEFKESLESLPFSNARYVTVNGKSLLLIRLTFVGELGFEFHVPYDDAVDLYNTLQNAADKIGVNIQDAGYAAIDSMSAEKGYRHWHADLSNAVTPFEANIGFTVSGSLKTKSQFLGREALEEAKEKGLRKKLVCLVVDDEKAPLHGLETIWKDGECVGYVKSTAFGHTIGKSIAYGYVHLGENSDVKKITNKWLKKGTYEIGSMGAKHSATLYPKSPYDPTNEKIMQ